VVVGRNDLSWRHFAFLQIHIRNLRRDMVQFDNASVIRLVNPGRGGNCPAYGQIMELHGQMNA
jgi:hypothetical protein